IAEGTMLFEVCLVGHREGVFNRRTTPRPDANGEAALLARFANDRGLRDLGLVATATREEPPERRANNRHSARSASDDAIGARANCRGEMGLAEHGNRVRVRTHTPSTATST